MSPFLRARQRGTQADGRQLGGRGLLQSIVLENSHSLCNMDPQLSTPFGRAPGLSHCFFSEMAVERSYRSRDQEADLLIPINYINGCTGASKKKKRLWDLEMSRFNLHARQLMNISYVKVYACSRLWAQNLEFWIHICPHLDFRVGDLAFGHHYCID